MKYIDTVWTVKGLIEVLKQLPDTAFIEVRNLSSAEIWYEAAVNTVTIK